MGFETRAVAITASASHFFGHHQPTYLTNRLSNISRIRDMIDGRGMPTASRRSSQTPQPNCLLSWEPNRCDVRFGS